MAWFKVDDQLAFHAKTVAAGNSAMGLWVRAGSWASAQLTGGFVPNAIANAMAKECDANALIAAGLWHEADGGYQFHEWGEWQPDADEERQRRNEIREKRKAAGRKGAEARWSGKRMASAMPSAMADATDPAWQSDSKAHGKSMAPSPSPSLTEPKGSVGGTPPAGRRKPAKPIPEDWSPTTSHEAKAKSLDLDVHAEADSFINHAISTDRRQADWDASFHRWLAQEVKYRQERSSRPQFAPKGQAKEDANLANLADWVKSKEAQQHQLPFPGGDPA